MMRTFTLMAMVAGARAWIVTQPNLVRRAATVSHMVPISDNWSESFSKSMLAAAATATSLSEELEELQLLCVVDSENPKCEFFEDVVKEPDLRAGEGSWQEEYSYSMSQATAAAAALAQEIERLAATVPAGSEVEMGGDDLSIAYPVRQRITKGDGWTQPAHRVTEELGRELEALAERCNTDPSSDGCSMLDLEAEGIDMSVDYPVRERITEDEGWTQPAGR